MQEVNIRTIKPEETFRYKNILKDQKGYILKKSGEYAYVPNMMGANKAFLRKIYDKSISNRKEVSNKMDMILKNKGELNGWKLVKRNKSGKEDIREVLFFPSEDSMDIDLS